MIEPLRIKDICERMEEIYSPNGCFIKLTISEKVAIGLNVNVSAEKVKEAILATPRIKLKED